MEGLLGLGASVIVGGVLIVAAIVGFILYRSWVKVPQPDEALVIRGKKSKDGVEELEVVKGKAVINPLTRRFEIMSLRSRPVNVLVSGTSADHISLKVKAVAMVKISSDDQHLRYAAERFGSQDKNIDHIVTEQLEGSLRGVVSTLDVEKLIKDRQEMSNTIRKNVSPELEKQGLIIDSFQIQDIDDASGYIQSLGVPQIERKKREAAVAREEAKREITKREIEVAEQNLIEETAYNENQANAAARVGEARAKAEQAEKLAAAQAEQAVLDQDVENEKRRLSASVNAKADSDYYRRQREADSEAYEQQKRAEAEYEVSKRNAEADFYVSEQQANAARVRSDAEAHAEKVKADAEAHAEREIGAARASAIEAEAAAVQKNREAYLANRAIEILPEMMTAFTNGYNAIGDLTIIGGGENGASNHMAQESANSMKSVFETMKTTTGIDLAGIMNSSVQGAAFGNAMESKRNQGATAIQGEATATSDTTPKSNDTPESDVTSDEPTRRSTRRDRSIGIQRESEELPEI